ncbi:Endonuclease/exonuclease/phosphatase [Suillus occidentalis]|nr:Endonuclease/exonuclease/phosphatase [Suillus occidentalis]
MRGQWHEGVDKWMHINQIMKEKKIEILAVQETHLSKDNETSLNETFNKRLKIISSIDPKHRNAKDIVITKGKKITILVVYAPNEPSKNGVFWEEVQTNLTSLPTPDVLLGDFNIVEDTLDRLPPKQDNKHATVALMCLKLSLDLRDRWRAENPDLLAYTYAQSSTQGGQQSRIDRIYISENILSFSKDWTIEPAGIATDHQLISARISDIRMPFMGRGRWTLPLFILKDKDIKDQIIDMGHTMQLDIKNLLSDRSATHNPQTIFKNFKDMAIKFCRDKARTSIPKIQNCINSLKSDLKACLNDQSTPEEECHLIGLELQE